MTTNLTTALAFLSKVPAPVMLMSAFGVFATFAIIHNTILDVIAIPCIVLTWERHQRSNRRCCFVPRQPGDTNLLPCIPYRPRTKSPAIGADVESGAVRAAPAGADAKAGSDSASSSDASEHKRRKVETFFRETYAPSIVRFRYPILVAMLALVGVMGYFAGQLRAAREPQ
jgi:predicted RND superfamily exporter protein